LDSKMLSFRSLAFVWKHPEGVCTCSSHPAIDRVEVNRKVVGFSHQKCSKNGDSQTYGFPLSLDLGSSRSNRYHLMFLPWRILPLGHFSLLTRRQRREMTKILSDGYGESSRSTQSNVGKTIRNRPFENDL
jgi:hypothetical protein